MTAKIYRSVSLSMTIIFGIVGALFLFMSADILVFFNNLGSSWGMTVVPPGEHLFFVALAVAYMYLVTLIAALMYRHPPVSTLPLLLFNGKCASAGVSIAFFVWGQPTLVLLANGIVDGSIALLAFAMYRSTLRRPG